MNIKQGLAAVTCAALSTAALAGADASTPITIMSYQTGSTYEALTEFERGQYLQGAIDGMIIGSLASGDRQRGEQLGRCISGMLSNQVLAIVDKYMADNPAQWDQRMNLLTYNAMQGACAQRGFPLPGPRTP